MWNKASLQQIIEERLAGYKLIVVANREPYIHRYDGDQINCLRPASGMASAMDPILRACGGTWVGHGSGNADRKTVDANDHIQVPPEDPSYTLRRVWLTREQENGYYYGLANEGLWPLCHVSFVRPVYEPAHWAMYREVNARFAEAVLQEAGQEPTFVFIQDYHFGLLPRMLKQANPNLIIAQFWHIPWPNSEQIRTFPWKEELVDGLLGNDLLGFHLRYHCQNFLDTVDRLLEARVDQERSEVIRGGRPTVVRPFPISIDYEAHDTKARSDEVEAAMERWRHRLAFDDQTILGIGIERIDYTKGIPDRLRGLARFLAAFPEYRERVRFVQVGVPSRVHIESYKQLDDEIDRLVEEINWSFGTENWQPITYFKRHFEPVDMMALQRLSRFGIVSSLHDGLNLVAKEYVSSRVDEDGVLILSQFTGAARELTDALLVNPYSQDEIAESIARAVTMPEPERRRRMQRMRQSVAENNIYRWAGKILHALLKFEFPDDHEHTDLTPDPDEHRFGDALNSLLLPGVGLSTKPQPVSGIRAINTATPGRPTIPGLGVIPEAGTKARSSRPFAAPRT